MQNDTLQEEAVFAYEAMDTGVESPPSPIGWKSPVNQPLSKQESDSSKQRNLSRKSYKEIIKNRCIECQPDGMGAVRECSCYECPLWLYRPYQSRSHKAAIAAERGVVLDSECLLGVDTKVVEKISEKILDARVMVFDKASKYCPQQLGHFKRAFSGRSRKAAVLADDLSLANFEKALVDEK